MPVLLTDKLHEDLDKKSRNKESNTEDAFGIGNSVLNSSQPVLAYSYSSDEDEPMTAEVRGPSSLRSSSPRPKSSSYSVREAKHDGRISSIFMGDGKTPLDALEYRSLPRQLPNSAEVSPEEVPLPLVRRMSSGKLSSSRASPEMDVLDNLLMNQSIQPGGSCRPANQGASGSDGSSDGSTCKASQPENRNSHPRECSDVSKTFEKFCNTLQHLRHHTTELELRTKRIESEFALSKKDLAKLNDTCRGMQSGVEELVRVVGVISEEVTCIRKQNVSQRKETEKMHKVASQALVEAKRSQEEYEVAKTKYEALITELHSLITAIKSPIVDPRAERRQKSGKEASIPEAKSPATATNSVHSKEQAKLTGYQSFFQRPSNLIYSLAYRSGSKSSSNVDKGKQEDRHRPQEERCLIRKTEPEGNKNLASSEIKQQMDKFPLNSFEKSKDLKTVRKLQICSEVSPENGSDKDGSDTPKLYTKSEHSIKKFYEISFDNIPMMDDQEDLVERKKSHININVSPAPNYGKSISSASVEGRLENGPPRRPTVLDIVPNCRELRSNSSSSDSPISGSPLQSRRISSLSSYNQVECYPKPDRQSQDSEERSISRLRQGRYPLSRQSSTPNIPSQRPVSATLFPLQRQHSLGTVPEEGQLPRQASLMSVPEERPIVDQTLPLSPSPSMISFPLSASPSGNGLNNLRDRNVIRNSMELVTGPVITGSHVPECYVRNLPPLVDFDPEREPPLATSSPKKNISKKTSASVHQ